MSSNWLYSVLFLQVRFFQFARKMDIFSIRAFFLLLFFTVLYWTVQYGRKTTTKLSLVEEKNEEKKGVKNASAA